MWWWIFLNTWERCLFSVCNTGGSEQNNWVLPTRSCCFAFQLLKACNKALKSNKFELYKKMSLVAQHFSELYMHDVRLLGICTISLNFLSTLQWQRQGRAWGPSPPPPPLIFRPNWGPKGRKNLGGDQSPRRPPPPPLIWGARWPPPPYLKVWIWHCISPLGQYSWHSLLTTTCVNHVIHFYFLLRHVAMAAIYLDFTKPWSCKNGRKNEKIDMYDFPAHDCTQELNSSPYLSSIDRQCKWPSLSRKIVEIQKFCSHW